MFMGRRTDKIVYKVTNVINKKCYIGWCVDFSERKSRHLKAAKDGVDTHFYAAIRKYGQENFTWEILFTGLSSYAECKELERKMIQQYNAYHNGYNSTLGGDGGNTYSKLSEERKTRFRELCSENAAKVWKGKTFSAEHIHKLKTADRSKQYKPIYQLNGAGAVIRLWSSVKEAAKDVNGLSTHLSRSAKARLNDKYIKAYGYYWAYNS